MSTVYHAIEGILPQVHEMVNPNDDAFYQEILEESFDYIDHTTFYEKNAFDLIFHTEVEIPEANASWYHPVLDTQDTKNDVNIVLNGQQEANLFMRYNFARMSAGILIAESENKRMTKKRKQHLLFWANTARYYRDQLAQFNLALVLAMARKFKNSDLDFADLISEGNMALLRSIDKFNVEKGFKLSTYACRAILKAFSRVGAKHTRYKSLFPTDFDPDLEKSDYHERKFASREDECIDEVQHIVINNRAELSEVEREVIVHRFAVDKGDEGAPMTLEQVGHIIGLTKERVRQIQNKALSKIRNTLERDFLDGKRHQIVEVVKA